MTETVQYRFLLRRGTAAALAAANEVLLNGEICLETDTGRTKIGDGTTHYTTLNYSLAGRCKVDGLSDGDSLVWNAALGLFVPTTINANVSPGLGIAVTEDSSGAKIIAVDLEAGDGIDLAETSNGALRITSSGGTLGTVNSTPDTTGTVTPPVKINNWVKMKFGADIYIVPAYKYLGEGSVSSLPTYISGLGPTAYWQMQESSGTTLHDDVAGETLTLSGSYTLASATLVTGDSRKSILFSGGMATGTAAAKWNLGGGDCAGTIVSRWTGTSLATHFSVRDGTSTNILAIINCNRVAAGDVNAENWDFNNHKANSPGTSYNTNAVHALGFNYENSTKTLSLYVDGAMVKSVVCSGTRPNVSTMLVHLASNFGSQNLSGNLQDFALFSKQLTAQQHLDISNIVLNGHT